MVEAAHPDVVTAHGARVLRHADLMALSVGALVDDAFRADLVATARRHRTRLLVPHGALVGLESLVATRHLWQDVRISFIKPPTSIEPAPADTTRRITMYEGPVRGIATRFPRNVNAMVTCALATVGPDRCRARLVSDPAQRAGILELEAHARDGALLTVRKVQPMSGVSGTEMAASVLQSLSTVTGSTGDMVFV